MRLKLALASMKPFALWMLLCLIYWIAILGALSKMAHSRDNGQWDGVDSNTRQWFKSLKNSEGAVCCAETDGHPAIWRGDNNGGYEVLIEGQWYSVPPEAVVRDYGNSTGESIVWYTPAGVMGELPRVRCFVPGVEG